MHESVDPKRVRLKKGVGVYACMNEWNMMGVCVCVLGRRRGK